MSERIFDHAGNFSIPKDSLCFHWSAGEVCFDCPCGEKEIILSEGGDMKRCDCGRVYRVSHFVEVDDGSTLPPTPAASGGLGAEAVLAANPQPVTENDAEPGLLPEEEVYDLDFFKPIGTRTVTAEITNVSKASPLICDDDMPVKADTLRERVERLVESRRRDGQYNGYVTTYELAALLAEGETR